ncbi:MBL fold metallo-hydrolase [Ensifer soli]|uniref:MBL fold metallo-hydrolase n=1 Tax=Ciceribacter sp. sgz301302 TaxID=3342379 RepID=UPI0035B833B8
MLAEIPLDGSLETVLAAGPGAETALYWLGQAGFVLDIAGTRLVIDPYLSDALSDRYPDMPERYARMMPAPVAAGALAHVDAVLCTHAHTDHMDPGTLPALFAANPRAVLVAPRAMRQAALTRSGLAEGHLRLVEAGETLELAPGIAVTATRAAHETLERDGDGNHRFLGYAVRGPELTVWHSGDTVPFDGQAAEVAALRPDVALLPVNGRRPELSQNGVPGNLFLDEAVGLAGAVGAAVMVAHHYGLFAFNTLDPETIDARARDASHPALLRARTGVALRPSRDA